MSEAERPDRPAPGRPVTVEDVNGDIAHLSSGPATGTPVVTVGVAELFGTENGIGQ